MFIRGIIVPILIVCLVLFIGVSFNQNGTDTNTGNGTETGDTNGTDSQNTTGTDGDIATTPSAITNRDSEGAGANGSNTNGASMSENGTTDNTNDPNYTFRETRLVNEIVRINGISNAKVNSVGQKLYIAVQKDSSDSQTNVELKEQIKRVVTNIDGSYERIFVTFTESEYNNFSSAYNNSDFSSFETRSDVITVY